MIQIWYLNSISDLNLSQSFYGDSLYILKKIVGTNIFSPEFSRSGTWLYRFLIIRLPLYFVHYRWRHLKKKLFRLVNMAFMNAKKSDPSWDLTSTMQFEPRHEISNNVVCATNKGSDQPAQTRSVIRTFASRLNMLWLSSYCPNIIWSFYRLVWV